MSAHPGSAPDRTATTATTGAAVRLGLRLAWGTVEQRVRSLLVALSTVVGTTLLLLVAAVASAQRAELTSAYAPAEVDRLVAAIVATVALPVLVLAGTAGRLSASLRDRRLANLRLLGLTPAQTRLVAATETGAAAVAGALVGAVVFVLARPGLTLVHVGGVDWTVAELVPAPVAWLLVLVGVPLAGVVLAVVPQRTNLRTSLERARRADVRPPSPWRVLPLVLGLALCGVVFASNLDDGDSALEITCLFGGIVLVGLGIVAVVPVLVRLVADLVLRRSRGATTTIAARRLQAQPAAVNRVVGALVVGLFLVVGARCVLVAFESVSQYQSAEHQVRVHQTQTIREPAGRTDAVAARVAGMDGVRRVLTLPTVQGTCGTHRYDSCTALVATCAQLRQVAPAVGCTEGRVENLCGPCWETTSAQVTFRALERGRPTGAPVLTPAPTIGPGGPGGSAPQGAAALEPLYADVLLPPSTPGVAALVARTDRTLYVTADPGRWLGDRLMRMGPLSGGSYDFAFLDFVALLRSIVWALAAVVLSVGLLTAGVAGIDRALARRREVTGLQLVGVPTRVLRRAQWLEAALPSALGSLLAVAAGLLAGATYLQIDSSDLALPWAQSGVLLGVALLASAAIAGLTVVAANPSISPETIRRE